MPEPRESYPARPRFFYGWVILGTGFSIVALGTGLNMSFGVFLRTLVQDYGWTSGMVSLTYSIFMLTSGIASVTAGRLADRFRLWLVFLGGSLIYGLGILLASQTSAIWHLYLFYGALAGLGNSPVNISGTMAVSRWFSKAQGLAMGILNSGTGVGPAIFGPLAGYLIMTYSWRNAYIILALTAWAMALTAFAFLRNDPRDVGALPYGEDVDRGARPLPAPAVAMAEAGRKSRPFHDVARTRTFWQLAILHFSCCVPSHPTAPYCALRRAGGALEAYRRVGDGGHRGKLLRWAHRLGGARGLPWCEAGLRDVHLRAGAHDAVGDRSPASAEVLPLGHRVGLWLCGCDARICALCEGVLWHGRIWRDLRCHQRCRPDRDGGGGWLGGLLYDLSGSDTSSWLLSVGAGLVTALLALHLRAPAKEER